MATPFQVYKAGVAVRQAESLLISIGETGATTDTPVVKAAIAVLDAAKAHEKAVIASGTGTAGRKGSADQRAAKLAALLGKK